MFYPKTETIKTVQIKLGGRDFSHVFVAKQSASKNFLGIPRSTGVSAWAPKTSQYRDPGLLDRGQAGRNTGLFLRPYGPIRGTDECFISNMG